MGHCIIVTAAYINAYIRIEVRNSIHYTTLTNFSTKYLTVCKFYTDVGGIK